MKYVLLHRLGLFFINGLPVPVEQLPPVMVVLALTVAVLDARAPI